MNENKRITIIRSYMAWNVKIMPANGNVTIKAKAYFEPKISGKISGSEKNVYFVRDDFEVRTKEYSIDEIDKLMIELSNYATNVTNAIEKILKEADAYGVDEININILDVGQYDP